MNKVYSFDDAYEVVDELDSSEPIDEGLTFRSEQLDAFEEDDMLPIDEFPDMDISIEDIIEDFQQFMREVLDELEYIMENETEKMGNVKMDYEILSEMGDVVQIYFSGSYMNFHYDHILVMPKYEWNSDREKVFKWVKAIVLREYKKFNGG